MFRYVICLVFLLPAVTLSQFITLRDGKIGVNFGGYHAEAGLGGLLTGNAAHGGLSASAGTPFGQRAGAGIGGTVLDGQTKGGAYAGASAGYGVGASAALGGNVDGVGASGGLGSEAHAGGVSKKTVKLSQTPQHPHQQDTVNEVYGGDRSLDARFDDDEELDVPQTPAPQPKISRGRKPHPRINLRRQSPRSQPQDSNSASDTTTRAPPTLPPNFFNDIFNIPISVLGAVNTFLNNNVKPGNSNSGASSSSSTNVASGKTL